MRQLSLCHIPAGKRVRIQWVAAPDGGMRGRLCALGLTPGTELDVCSQGHGCCVRLRDTSIVLGNNMAEHIMCEPLETPPQESPALPC